MKEYTRDDLMNDIELAMKQRFDVMELVETTPRFAYKILNTADKTRIVVILDPDTLELQAGKETENEFPALFHDHEITFLGELKALIRYYKLNGGK